MTFRKATKYWLEQLDSKEGWVYMQRVPGHEHFNPLYLVQKKRKTVPWQTCSYKTTFCKLEDVLLSKDQIADLVVLESDLLPVKDKMSRKMKGNLGASADVATANVMGAASASASESHDWTVTLKTKYIIPYKLPSRIENVNMDHELIKQLKKPSEELYVITEALVIMEKYECDESTGKGGCFSVGADIIRKLGVKLELEGESQRSKGITIPEGCVLAFRVCRLFLFEGYLEKEEFTSRELYEVRSEGKRKDLQREIETECAQLFLLPANLCGKFLTGFVAIMRESDLLGELLLQLERALEGADQLKLKADRPEVQGLVDNLQDSSGTLYTDLADPILYFLQALEELTELQLSLLAESVEKKIVFKQRALVESIIDTDFSEKEEDFTIGPQLVFLFSKEELNLTGLMIESSGARMKKYGPGLAGTGDPDAFLPLCSLYVALHILTRIQKHA